MSNDKGLGDVIGKIETLLNNQTSENLAVKRCVRYIAEDIVKPWLTNLCSDVVYTGCNYDGTALPGKDDFDVQFCIRLSGRVEAVTLDLPACRGIKGGPPELSDGISKGLSNDMARLKVLSQVDRGLSHTGRFNYDGQSVELTRATGGDGKSTILKAKWAGKQFRVNVIPAIKSEDIKNSNGNLVAEEIKLPKNFTGGSLWHGWVESFAKREQAKLKSFSTSAASRRLTLLKMVKLVREHSSQLRLISSVVLKHALFHLCDSYNSDDYWNSQQKLVARFKDMMRLLAKSFREGRMENYFDRRLNLLGLLESSSLEQVANFLMRIVEYEGYSNLFNSLVIPGKKLGHSRVMNPLIIFVYGSDVTISASRRAFKREFVWNITTGN